MKPLTNRIRDAAKLCKLARDIIELDYIISYILAGIFTQDKLRETLVFKGGTALKKLYFGEYRFSEDLDFSTRNYCFNTVEDSLAQAKNETENLLQQYGQFSISMERYVEKNPHPERQEAFIYRIKFPWHNEPLCRLKIEITRNEQVLDVPKRRQLLHGYEEDLSAFKIVCLSLEEIVAEKMRSLLQTRKKFYEGKNRPRSRDYYDLWSVMNQFGDNLDTNILESLLKPKCSFRNVYYTSLDDFFDVNLLNEAGKYWKTSLGRLLANLPDFNKLINELKALIPKFFPSLNLKEQD